MKTINQNGMISIHLIGSIKVELTNRLENFVTSSGAHQMIDIFTKTDLADVDNFLKLKISNQIFCLITFAF